MLHLLDRIHTIEPVLSQHMSKDGADVVFDASVDASGGDQYWEFRPSSGLHVVTRLLVTVRDTGTFDAEDYGNRIELTNGITAERVQGAGGGADVLQTFTDLAIKNNVAWATYSHDLAHYSFGTGDEFITVRWSFFKSGTDGIKIDSNLNQALRITINDDFTGLEGHFFVVQGRTAGSQ